MAQNKPDLTRYVIWGSVAACAVLATTLTIALAVNSTRKPVTTAAKPTVPPVAVAPAQKSGAVPGQTNSAASPQITLPVRTQAEIEMSKMQDALRALAAERDRLVNRVDQLEKSVGDITASITKEKDRPAPPAPQQQQQRTDNSIQPSRQSPAMPLPRPDNAPQQMAMQNPQQQMQPQMRGQQQRLADDDDLPPQRNAPPNTGTFNQSTLNARQQIHPPPVPQAPPGANRQQLQQQALQQNPQSQMMPQDSTATRTEFAIDLGGEASIDGLRALWANIRGNHGAALEGLRPLVSVRDGVKPGTVELRLVAGPLANAGAAARACAMLQQKGVPCQTTIFDGQRLALR